MMLRRRNASGQLDSALVLVDRVEHTHDRIVVTRNGRPAAVMISPEELESIEDTLELLSEPVAMAEIAEARRAADYHC